MAEILSCRAEYRAVVVISDGSVRRYESVRHYSPHTIQIEDDAPSKDDNTPETLAHFDVSIHGDHDFENEDIFHEALRKILGGRSGIDQLREALNVVEWVLSDYDPSEYQGTPDPY